MKTQVQEGNFHCSTIQMLAAFCSVLQRSAAFCSVLQRSAGFCSVFGWLGIAQAECIGGVGTDDIVISNKAADFYISGDMVDCITTTGSITLGPDVTIPDGVMFNLVAPGIFIETDVEFLMGSQLRILTGRRPLNDTGITTCGDDSSNWLPCPQGSFPGQDAEYGRDADDAHNDDLDGHAGFSFTKLDADGNPLSSSATMWSCIKDNVTGLIWEVKTDDGGLQDKDSDYSWYNPDDSMNGGDAGTQNGGACTGSDCDTQGYVQAVNTQGLCGANDWRMPAKKELENIASRDDRYRPAIDTDYFPNTSPAGYWSASPYVGNGGGYPFSASYRQGKAASLTVRLVRDGQ